MNRRWMLAALPSLLIHLGCPMPSSIDAGDPGEPDGGDPEPDVQMDPDAGEVDAGPEIVAPSGSFGWNEAEANLALIGRWAPLVADRGDGRAILFGGTDIGSFGGDPLDDVMVFDARSAVPTLVAVEPATRPSARYCGCAAWDPVRERAVVIGGRSLNSFFTDAWAYDVEDNSFAELAAANSGPATGLGCSLAYRSDDDGLYLFGGASPQTGSGNDLWRLDPGTGAWAMVDDGGTAPGVRYDASLSALDDGTLLMSSGAENSQSGFHADVWVFSFESAGAGTWTELVGDGGGPQGRRVPWIRVEPGSTSTSGGLIMGFGNNGGEVLGDLWRFDIAAATWTDISPTRAPDERGFSPALPGGPGVIGYVMGGFNLSDPVIDLWRLDADESDTVWWP